jgi:hypothetical protein
MAQLFTPRANTIIRLVLVAVPCLFVVFVAYAYYYANAPYSTGEKWIADQPVPFSHKHHVGGLGLDCRYCHEGVEDAAFAGIPPTSTCMTCHSQLWTNAAVLAPVRNSLATDTPLRWNRVYALPDYVFFDHSVHVRNGVGCTSCHGDMAEQPLTRQQTPLTMGWCLDCHRDPGRHLRPEDRIFDPHAPDPDNGPVRAAELLRHYVIKTENMTDCSTCHR